MSLLSSCLKISASSRLCVKTISQLPHFRTLALSNFQQPSPNHHQRDMKFLKAFCSRALSLSQHNHVHHFLTLHSRVYRAYRAYRAPLSHNSRTLELSHSRTSSRSPLRLSVFAFNRSHPVRNSLLSVRRSSMRTLERLGHLVTGSASVASEPRQRRLYTRKKERQKSVVIVSPELTQKPLFSQGFLFNFSFR